MNEAHQKGDPVHDLESEVDDLPPIEDEPDLDGDERFALEGDALGSEPNAPAGAGRDALAPHNAAGVVLVRTTDMGPRVAVLESGGVISLPKAEVGPGMSAETAANRAAQAFTGQRVRLAESVGELEEWIDGAPVTTWFWLARPTRGVALDPATPPPPGFTLHWIDLEEACHALTSDGEASLVERVRSLPFAAKRRPFASPDKVGLARDLEAFRDQSVASARGVNDPDQLDALLRARDEIERAEDRLARGDAAGARRARNRAERETLASLDAEGRALAFQRALDRAPDRLRMTLAAAAPPAGHAISLDVLMAVHAAVDAAIEEEEREREVRRAAQGHATAALVATTAAVLAAAFFGLFKTAPRPVLTTTTAAIVFVSAGVLGGWVGESLFALRERNRNRHIALHMAAAAGALAGLAVGAVLSSGLSTFVVEDAALTIAATFAAGWLIRTVLPRGA